MSSFAALVAAIREQAGTLISCTEIFHNDQRAAYRFFQAAGPVLNRTARRGYRQRRRLETAPYITPGSGVSLRG